MGIIVYFILSSICPLELFEITGSEESFVLYIGVIQIIQDFAKDVKIDTLHMK